MRERRLGEWEAVILLHVARSGELHHWSRLFRPGGEFRRRRGGFTWRRRRWFHRATHQLRFGGYYPSRIRVHDDEFDFTSSGGGAREPVRDFAGGWALLQRPAAAPPPATTNPNGQETLPREARATPRGSAVNAPTLHRRCRNSSPNHHHLEAVPTRKILQVRHQCQLILIIGCRQRRRSSSCRH